jgi:hypothetical protein
METEGSPLCSQRAATWPYLGPDFGFFLLCGAGDFTLLSVAGLYSRRIWWQMNDNLEKDLEGSGVVSQSKYYPRIFLQVLRKSRKSEVRVAVVATEIRTEYHQNTDPERCRYFSIFHRLRPSGLLQHLNQHRLEDASAVDLVTVRL